MQWSKAANINGRIGPTKVRDIQAVDITTNLADWQTDIAVMFYAPWCKHCKQLFPSWEAIAGLLEGKKDLVIARLNCEGEKDNVKLCTALNVDRYPTVMFFGYGDFHQAPRDNVFGKQLYPQMVHFVADLYPEAIYDWVHFVAMVSGAKRRWADFLGLFTGKTRTQKRLQLVEAKLREAEKKLARIAH